MGVIFNFFWVKWKNFHLLKIDTCTCHHFAVNFLKNYAYSRFPFLFPQRDYNVSWNYIWFEVKKTILSLYYNLSNLNKWYFAEFLNPLRNLEIYKVFFWSHWYQSEKKIFLKCIKIMKIWIFKTIKPKINTFLNF
jgi:hypothetical protein